MTTTVPVGVLRLRPPRPLRSAALVLAPLPLIAGLWALGLIPPAIAQGSAAFLVLFALVQAALDADGLRRSRRRADAALRSSPGVPPASALTAWRAAELTSARSRRELGRHLRALRRETEVCQPSNALRLLLLEEIALLLRELEQRLEPAAGQVSPLGMLELHTLVRDDVSPLFLPERASELPSRLSHALAALEPE